MTDEMLEDLLERAADGIHVGAVPLSNVRTRVGRRAHRRRTAVAVLTSAAAVALVIAGTVALVTSDDKAPDGPLTPPARLVGVGHVGIQVPEGWQTVRAQCGLGDRDSVLLPIGHGRALFCKTPPAAGVETIAITHGVPRPRHVDYRFEIDGVAAERDRTTCDHSARPVCQTHVYLRSEPVTVTITSATDRASVERLVNRIRVLPDRLSVPDFQDLDDNFRLAREYTQRLEDAGFKVALRTTRDSNREPGSLTKVAPRIGTMVRPGSTVTVTTVADPRPPARQVTMSLNASSPHTEPVVLSDAEIRDGAAVTVKVGGSLYLRVEGPRQDDFDVVVDADMLRAVNHGMNINGPDYADFNWSAVKIGRTTMTLTLKLDGKRVTIGKVTVTVRSSAHSAAATG